MTWKRPNANDHLPAGARHPTIRLCIGLKGRDRCIDSLGGYPHADSQAMAKVLQPQCLGSIFVMAEKEAADLCT